LSEQQKSQGNGSAVPSQGKLKTTSKRGGFRFIRSLGIFVFVGGVLNYV